MNKVIKISGIVASALILGAVTGRILLGDQVKTKKKSINNYRSMLHYLPQPNENLVEDPDCQFI